LQQDCYSCRQFSASHSLYLSSTADLAQPGPAILDEKLRAERNLCELGKVPSLDSLLVAEGDRLVGESSTAVLAENTRHSVPAGGFGVVLLDRAAELHVDLGNEDVGGEGRARGLLAVLAMAHNLVGVVALDIDLRLAAETGSGQRHFSCSLGWFATGDRR